MNQTASRKVVQVAYFYASTVAGALIAYYGVYPAIQKIYGALSQTEEAEIQRRDDANTGVVLKKQEKRFFPEKK